MLSAGEAKDAMYAEDLIDLKEGQDGKEVKETEEAQELKVEDAEYLQGVWDAEELSEMQMPFGQADSE